MKQKYVLYIWQYSYKATLIPNQSPPLLQYFDLDHATDYRFEFQILTRKYVVL